MSVGVQNAEFVILNLVVRVETAKLSRVKKLTKDRSLNMRPPDIHLELKVCFRLNRDFIEI